MLRRQAVIGRKDLGRGLLGEARDHVVADGDAARDQAAPEGVDDGPARGGVLALLHGERHEARDVEFAAVA